MSNTVYVNEYGVTTAAPGNEMFWAAAVIGVLILIPVAVLKKKGLKK